MAMDSGNAVAALDLPVGDGPRSAYLNTCQALKVPPNSKVERREKVGLFSEEKIDLSLNYVGSLGFQAMIQSLAENTHLHTLIAPNNGLSNEVVTFFCRAFAHHPSLSVIDFSGNPLSLPAALALTQLVHTNPKISEIILTNTNIVVALRRIRRALNLRKTSAAAKALSAADAPQMTPYRKVREEYEQRHAEKKLAAASAAEAAEAAAPGEIAQWVAAVHLPRPLRADAGWSIVNVFISSTPTDFISELRAIHRDIIPKMNEKFAARKVWLHPVSMYVNNANSHGAMPSPLNARAAVADRYACTTDHRAAITKCRPLFVHLFGEKIGPLQYVSQSGDHDMSEGSPRKRQETLYAVGRPIQEIDYEAACATVGCNIVLFRQSVLKIDAPSSLIGLLTDNPHLVHPDPNFPLVRAAIAEARGTTHHLATFDMDVERARWERHVEFQKGVLRKHPPAFLVKKYEAKFDAVDADGHLRLSGLEGFCSSLASRLEAAVGALFPLEGIPENEAQKASREAFCASAMATPPGRKHLLNKLDVYAVTPPSRNMALVCGPAGSGNTTLLRSFVRRSLKRGGYRLAFHFCHDTQLHAEPSDPRTVFLSLAAQLLPDGQLPLYIKHELDVLKVKQFLGETLAAAAAGAGDQILLLAIEGLDDIDPYILPCRALRTGDTGTDLWNPPPPGKLVPHKPSSAPSSSRAPAVDDYDWLPVCLPRNVRIVATTVANSQTQTKLCFRGHDSCDPLIVGDLFDNDLDAFIVETARQHQVELSEAERGIIRQKADATNPQFLQYVFHVLQSREESPSYFSRPALLQQIPPRLSDCCASTIRLVEREFGIALARNYLCLLALARWGLLEVEIRQILQAQFGHKSSQGDPDFISYEILQGLERRVRPWLHRFVEFEKDGVAIPPSGFDCLVHIASRVFRATVVSKYLSDDADYERRVHQQLAGYYRRVAFTPNQPLQSRAVKELPYHVVASGMWDTFTSTVLSLDFLSLVYKHGHGYSAVRELIRTYNLLDSQSVAVPAGYNVESLKLKLHEFIYFMRDHNTNMVQYPHMVHQIAMTLPTDTLVYNDAKNFFKTLQPHFAVVSKSKVKLHRDRVTSCQFAPSGLRIASCSDDRGIRICNLFGETLVSINQSISKTKLLKYSPTSRYLSVVAEDHSLLIFDASSGSLIAKASNTHTSAIDSLCMSARGRYVVTGGRDRVMKVWESETGGHVATASHTSFSLPTSAFSSVGVVASDPVEEGTFYAMCDGKLIRWKLSHARDELEQTLLIQGHSSKPLGSFHVVDEGAYVVTCARDLAAQASRNVHRTEDNLKVWSLTSGRLVATMTLGSTTLTQGPVFASVSPNERIVASALLDGSIQLHELDCRSFATELTEPLVVTPHRHLAAFSQSPTPAIAAICFSFDSGLVCAAGNERHIKVWDMKITPGVGDQDPVAEFLMDQPMTCIDWTPSPADEGGELIVGDAVGKLHVLRLIH